MRQLIGLVQAASSLLSRVGAFVAAVVLLAMTGLILTEIALRTFFDSSTYVLEEMVGYGTATMTFLALGYALEKGAMIRVGLLIGRLRPAGLARRLFEVVSIAVTMGIFSLAIWAFGRSALRAYARGTDSGTLAATPVWIPEGIVLVGMIVFWIQLLAYLLRVLTEPDLRPQSDDPLEFNT